jgi:hypothetical protein
VNGGELLVLKEKLVADLLVGLPLLVPEERLAKGRELVDVDGAISATMTLPIIVIFLITNTIKNFWGLEPPRNNNNNQNNSVNVDRATNNNLLTITIQMFIESFRQQHFGNNNHSIIIS